MAGRVLPLLLVALGGLALGTTATLLLVRPDRPDPPLPTAAAPGAPAVPARAAVTAEEAAVRQTLAARLRSPDAMRLEDVRVWRFGPPDERAVCGTMRSPEIPGGSARFVVRVLMPREGASASSQLVTVVEDAPGLVRATPEASRRFCREPPPEPLPVASGPGSAGATGAAPPPGSAGDAAPGQWSGTAGAAAAGSGADVPSGGRARVVTQGPANLRAYPGGEVLGTVARGRTLQVFDRTAGGWAQVGETAPEGWIHSSLLSDLPPP